MALKHGSSASLELAELTDLIKAFEAQNTVMITLEARIVGSESKQDLEWKAKAWNKEVGITGRQLLGFASARCLEKRLVTMEAVILNLLYSLDFQLAEGEMQGCAKKRA